MWIPKSKRREFLKHASGILALSSVSLPFFSFNNSAKAATTTPLKLLIITNSLGIPLKGNVREDQWVTPTSSVTKLGTLKPILQPLANFKDNLIVLSGINLKPDSIAGGGHPIGSFMGLTGAFPDYAIGKSGGPSIEVAIGTLNPATTAFNSLQVNVGGISGNSQLPMSWDYQGNRLPRISGAADLYSKLFNTNVGASSVSKQKVLALIDTQIAQLRLDLNSATATTALDAYKTSVDDLTNQLIQLDKQTCSKPTAPIVNNIPSNLTESFNLIQHAFSCDLTRSIALDIGGTSSRIRHDWIDNPLLKSKDHHGISHGDTDVAFEAMCLARRWYAEQIAVFLQKLASTPDIDGNSQLDNTVIFWTTETSTGLGHKIVDYPYLLIAGKNTGLVQGGYHYNFTGRYTNDVLTSLLKVFNLPSDKFGDADSNQGPLEIFV